MSGSIIWVEGLIGSGKTTLTEKIAQTLNLRALYEPVEANPYLKIFYEDPKRWAFPMQIHLLHCRYALQKLAAYEATTTGGYAGAVIDRGLPGDRVFCRLHMLAGNISELEWQTYEKAYDIMTGSLTPPSLLLFLNVEPEVALERIKKRNRGAETSMTLDYLVRLRKGYLDLLVEIESGEHAWSRGMRVVQIPWNTDHQPIDKLIDILKHQLRL